MIFQPRQQRVQDDPADDKTSVETLRVNLVRIPFAEHVVRTLVDRMRVVVSSQVQREFVQIVQTEPRFGQQVVGRVAKILQRVFDEFLVRTIRHTGIANEQRNGPVPFVIVWFHLLFVFQNCQRTVAKKIVELLKRSIDDALRFVPRTSLRDNGFEHFRQEERLVEFQWFQVKQNIAVVPDVRGERFVQSQPNDFSRLRYVSESGFGSFQRFDGIR